MDGASVKVRDLCYFPAFIVFIGAHVPFPIGKGADVSGFIVGEACCAAFRVRHFYDAVQGVIFIAGRPSHGVGHGLYVPFFIIGQAYGASVGFLDGLRKAFFIVGKAGLPSQGVFCL